MRRKPRVVTIGGGTGLYTLLQGLREYDLDLTAIVAMTDDGGSTGELRDEFGVLPPGDLRRCIVALSQSPELMKQLFQYRFERGAVAGHSFGNLFITALREITGSDEQAIEQAARLLRVRGRVLPVTLENRRLHATLEDGTVVKGETNIDVPKHNGDLAIREVSLNRPAKANPRVLEAIRGADMIILGPGDLYGSIVTNLLVDDVAATIRRSRADVVYVCNLMTKYGETNGFAVHDFVNTIEHYLGRGVLDVVVFSQVRLSDAMRQAYGQERSEPVKFDRSLIRRYSAKFIRASLAARGNFLRHDSRRLARVIWALIQSGNALTYVE
ncbi:YvcK family protein [Candidatus Berkelbacteria bacterium]|nr:YvcK family protein [Candidatus Berkelbacteria bacterium]